MLLYNNLQTVRHHWLYLQYEHMNGKGHTKCNMDSDSYTCDSESECH